MHSQKRHDRQTFCGTITVLLVASILIGTPEVFAASQDATVFFRPHCDLHTEDGDTVFGPVPDVEGMVGPAPGSQCPRFDVEDPQTLKTIPFNIGDVLNFDVAVQNPSHQSIQHVRSWIAYDTNVFEGVSIALSPNFPLITPGESDFDHMNGYIMIEASNDAPGANANAIVSVAQIQLRAKIAPPSGTFISFYDIQQGGHTSLYTKENGNDAYILGEEPGGLHVIFVQENPPPTSDQPPAQDQPTPGNFPNPEDFFQDVNTQQTPPADETPQESPEHEPLTVEAPPTPPEPNGGSCMVADDCESNNCQNGICTAAEEPSGADEPSTPATRTAFALLQVRNLRATTEGSSVFLAWDELNSSSLKAYNIYFGTTTGRYIQRKTIDGSMKSVVIRNLPIGTTYYFAIRAVSTEEEESAFSQEVAVEVGNAETSTSPLVEDATMEVVTENPIGDLTGKGAITVPGETGSSSTIALLFVVCAIVGTFVASRRQMIVTTQHPSHE